MKCAGCITMGLGSRPKIENNNSSISHDGNTYVAKVIEVKGPRIMNVGFVSDGRTYLCDVCIEGYHALDIRPSQSYQSEEFGVEAYDFLFEKLRESLADRFVVIKCKKWTTYANRTKEYLLAKVFIAEKSKITKRPKKGKNYAKWLIGLGYASPPLESDGTVKLLEKSTQSASRGLSATQNAMYASQGGAHSAAASAYSTEGDGAQSEYADESSSYGDAYNGDNMHYDDAYRNIPSDPRAALLYDRDGSLTDESYESDDDDSARHVQGRVPRGLGEPKNPEECLTKKEAKAAKKAAKKQSKSSMSREEKKKAKAAKKAATRAKGEERRAKGEEQRAKELANSTKSGSSRDKVRVDVRPNVRAAPFEVDLSELGVYGEDLGPPAEPVNSRVIGDPFGVQATIAERRAIFERQMAENAQREADRAEYEDARNTSRGEVNTYDQRAGQNGGPTGARPHGGPLRRDLSLRKEFDPMLGVSTRGGAPMQDVTLPRSRASAPTKLTKRVSWSAKNDYSDNSSLGPPPEPPRDVVTSAKGYSRIPRVGSADITVRPRSGGIKIEDLTSNASRDHVVRRSGGSQSSSVEEGEGHYTYMPSGWS